MTYFKTTTVNCQALALGLLLLGAIGCASSAQSNENWFENILAGKSPDGTQMKESEPSKTGSFGNFMVGYLGADSAFDSEALAVGVYGKDPWCIDLRFRTENKADLFLETLRSNGIDPSGIILSPEPAFFRKSNRVTGLKGLPSGWRAFTSGGPHLRLFSPEISKLFAAVDADEPKWPKGPASHWMGKSIADLNSSFGAPMSADVGPTTRNMPSGFGYGDMGLRFHFAFRDGPNLTVSIPVPKSASDASTESPVEYVMLFNHSQFRWVKRDARNQHNMDLGTLKQALATVNLDASTVSASKVGGSANLWTVTGLSGISEEWTVTTSGSDLRIVKR